MKQHPKVHSDSFWADLANALALRPVHRAPLHQPTEPSGEPATPDVATAEVSLDVSAQQSASSSSSSPVTPLKDEEVAAPQQNAEEPKVEPSPEATESTEDTQTTETADESWRISGVTAATQDEAVKQVRQLLREQRTRTHSTEADAALVNLREAVKTFEAAVGTSTASDEPADLTDHFIEAKSGAIAPRAVQYIAPENIRYATTPDVKDLVNPVITPDISKSLQPDLLSIRRRLRQVLRPSKQKLDRRQLKDLGLSPQEAAVAEGLFKGWNAYRIAMRTGTTQPRVNALITRMMTKFDVKQTHSLLKVLLARHQDRKPSRVVGKRKGSASALGGFITDTEVIVEPTGPVPAYIPKPDGISIPEGHPEHPNHTSNEKGYGFGPKATAEPKREPAHRSDDSDPHL